MGTKICPTCKGHGTIIKKVYKTTICLDCFGTGYKGYTIDHESRRNGLFEFEVPVLKKEKCLTCGGEGKLSSFVGEKYITCPTCEGRGHIYEEYRASKYGW